ncbi:hypothetical protein ACFOW1_00860 [Parasediminibacterium paludis]|uniref:Uncharacterized protein n=1 Tax=Parasediminibacterium paludis TaxID=908966 RepID=A0ABV8PSY1_9BACT
MIRQIITPTSNTYTLTIPNELVGKQIEVLVFELETSKHTVVTNEIAELDNFYNAIKLDFSDFKFDRDAANER